jgi:hypothetical protein
LDKAYALRIAQPFRDETAKNLSGFSSFTYLGSERFGPDHLIFDDTLIQAVFYELRSARRTIYYTFRFDNVGRVAYIGTDE